MKKDNNSDDRGKSALSQVETKVDQLINKSSEISDQSSAMVELISSVSKSSDQNRKDISDLVKAVSTIADVTKKREDASIVRDAEHKSQLHQIIQEMEQERAKNAKLEDEVKRQNKNISKLTDAVTILTKNAEQNQKTVVAVLESLSGLAQASQESSEHLGNGLNLINVNQIALENKMSMFDERAALSIDILDRMAVRVDKAANRLEKIDGALETGFKAQREVAIEIAERQYHTISAPLKKLRKIAPAMEQQAENIRQSVIMFQNTNTTINKANLRNYKQLEVVANALNNKIEDTIEFGVARIAPTIVSKMTDQLEPGLRGMMVHLEKVKVELEKLESNVRNFDFSSVDSLEESINGVRVVCEDTTAALTEQQDVAIEFSKQQMAQTQECNIENEKLIIKFNALNKGAEQNLKLVSSIQSEYINIVNISETISSSINQLMTEKDLDSKEYLIQALSVQLDEIKTHFEVTLEESSQKSLLGVLGHTPDDQQ